MPNSIEKLVNKQFPPISYLDQQDSSLRINQEALDLINSPDFSINIGAKDFNNLFDSAVSEILRSKKLTIPHVSKYEFDKLKTSTGKQFINISTNFSLELDTLNAKLAGNFSGIVTFAVRNDSLIFFPALKTLHLDNVSFNKINKTDKNVLVSLINNTLKTFMNNINGFIRSKTPNIDINLTNKKINSHSLPHNDTISIALSKPIEISLPILLGVCMIDELGIHISGSYDYGSRFGVGNPKAERIAKLFDNDYSEFKSDYYSKIKAAFTDAPSNNISYFVIQKKSIASVISQTLLGEIITAVYKKDLKPTPVDKEIMLHSNDLNYDNINISCPQLHIVPSCAPPSYDCGKFNFPCQAEYAVKFAAYQAALPTCLSAKAAEIATNLTLQRACDDAKNAAKITLASIKATINAAGGEVDFGSVKIDADATLKVNAVLKGIKANQDLSSIIFTLQNSDTVPVNINFQLHSKTAGKIICPFNVQYRINPIGTAQINNSITSKITFNKTNDNQINLVFEVSSIPVEALLSPNPLTEIDRLMPSFVSCPIIFPIVAGIPVSLNVIKGFRDVLNGGDGGQIQNLIFDGKYNFNTPVYPIKLPIQSKPIKLFNDSIILKPLISNTYLGFSNGS